MFFAFRIMVATGLLMLAVSWLSVWQMRRSNREVGVPKKWLLRVLVAMTFSGWVALVAGWYVTEIGRQPWLVYGVLTAAQAASEVPASNILFTLITYVTLYAGLLFAYISVLFHLARKGAPANINGG